MYHGDGRDNGMQGVTGNAVIRSWKRRRVHPLGRQHFHHRPATTLQKLTPSRGHQFPCSLSSPPFVRFLLLDSSLHFAFSFPLSSQLQSDLQSTLHTKMTSRININRPAPQSYSPPPYPSAAPSHMNMGGAQSPGSFDASSESPLETVRVWASLAEDQIDILSQPLRPYLPALGRFLIVVTFLEDALRIVSQWGDQLWYLQK